MKRALLLLAALLPATHALADTETVNGIEYTYSVYEDDGEGEAYLQGDWGWDEEAGYWRVPPVISQSTEGAISIPSTLGGHPVTGIG